MQSFSDTKEHFLSAVAGRLFVFDMDGTLLVKTTACLEIAKTAGTLDHLHVLEAKFASGEIDAFGFAQEIAALWGLLDEHVVRQAFSDTPKLDNIQTVTNVIRNGGGKSCLITMSPDFFAHLFYDYGFDFIVASKFPKTTEEEMLPEHILNPKDKALIVSKLCGELGIEMRRCVAFGDSMSDYLLFKELEHTVAVNADATLQSLARYHYDGRDLQDALINVCHELAVSGN
jgi:phosphoserine phosphatase